MASIFDEYTTTATQDFIMPKVIDSVLDQNVLTSRLLGNTKKFRGEQHKSNVRVGVDNASAAQGGGFRGTDTFNTNVQNETKQFAFNPKFVYEPINFVGTDIAVNTGQEEVMSIVTRETEYSLSNMLDNVGSMLYGTATDSSKDFSGLRHIIDQTATYGGLSKSTYTVLKSGDTSGSGVDGTTTTLTLAAMRAVSNALTSGGEKTSLIITTPAVFGFFEALLQPTQQLNIGGYMQVTRDKISAGKAALGGAAGFDALAWDGVTLVRDEKCPTDHMFFLNEKYLDFYRVDGFMKQFGHKDISFRPQVVEGQYAENGEAGHKTGFSWSGFKEPVNQAAVNSQVFISGELITTNPRRQGGFTALAA